MGKEVSLGMGVEGEGHLQKGLSGPGVTKAVKNFSITKETFITALFLSVGPSRLVSCFWWLGSRHR